MENIRELTDLCDEAYCYLRAVSDGTSPICVPILYEDQRVAKAMDEARGDLFKAMSLVHKLLKQMEAAEAMLEKDDIT